MDNILPRDLGNPVTTDGIRCALMRGGTSKGAVFVASDLPSSTADLEAVLLRIMGSPDERQVDGVGGAHPLTSKVAVVSASAETGVDVDYLFLQVVVDRPVVSTAQTCGNMLSAVGPFALLRGLLPATGDVTEVRVRMVNTGALATLRVQTPGGRVTFDGDAEITGVPGTAAPVAVIAEPSDAPLLPTGNRREAVSGLEVTCIDHGMPSVLVRAQDLGMTGTEAPQDLEADRDLVQRVRALRAGAAAAMGLPADLDATTVPKVVLVGPPAAGGAVVTRSFIPDRVHEAIGVLGAATVAAAARLEGTVAHDVATLPVEGRPLRIEHPTGFLDVDVTLTDDPDRPVGETTLLRTARLLMDGTVYPAPERSPSTPHRP